MKKRLSYILISIFTLILGITAVCFYYQSNFPQFQTENEAITVNNPPIPRFRYVSGSPICSPVDYRFQSSTEPKVFGADCVFCKELDRDLGNIGVYKKSTSPEQIQFLFKMYTENRIVEKSFRTDINGSRIGDKVVWLSKDNGKVRSAGIVWTENNDFWMIDAPTLELVKEFEKSETFKSVKEEVDSECISK